MIVAMFRTYLKPQANLDELGVLHQKMHAIVTNMPGFISVKMFTAEDGEVLALAEFDSLDSLKAWKEHPEHVVAQQRGARNSSRSIVPRSAARSARPHSGRRPSDGESHVRCYYCGCEMYRQRAWPVARPSRLSGPARRPRHVSE